MDGSLNSQREMYMSKDTFKPCDKETGRRFDGVIDNGDDAYSLANGRLNDLKRLALEAKKLDLNKGTKSPEPTHST